MGWGCPGGCCRWQEMQGLECRCAECDNINVINLASEVVKEWRVEFYQSSNGTAPVLEWFREQEPKVQAKLAQIFDLLQEQGIAVGKPYVAPLVDKLYEIRIEQNTNIFRVVYFAHTGQRFILLHGFQKKTQKTPRGVLELAKERMKAFLEAEQAPPLEPPPPKPKPPKKRKTR